MIMLWNKNNLRPNEIPGGEMAYDDHKHDVEKVYVV